MRAFGNGLQSRTPVTPVGTSLLEIGQSIPIDWRSVSPGYFRTMEIPLLRGRLFTDADADTAPNVTIVSQATAKSIWGSGDPLGKELRVVGSGKEFTVVGVVADVRGTTLNTQPYPTMYYSANAITWPTMDVVVRTSLDPLAALSAARQKLRDLDPDLPMSSVRSMDEWISDSAAQPRLNAELVASFGCLTLSIAAISVYGVLSYTVNQRRGEIGLRLALGAAIGRLASGGEGWDARSIHGNRDRTDGGVVGGLCAFFFAIRSSSARRGDVCRRRIGAHFGRASGLYRSSAAGIEDRSDSALRHGINDSDSA
jgi:hypothetical protein